MGGLAVRCAQSRGEWPGSRRTFREGRAEGARVDVEGAREEVDGFRDEEGGARSVEAADGGGRRLVEGFGGTLNVGLVMVGFGCGGGAIGLGVCFSTFRVAAGFVRVGGSMAAFSEGMVGWAATAGFISGVEGLLAICSCADAVCSFSCSPSSRVKVGTSS